MKRGLFILILSYILSQFYRAFLPVLTQVLEADIGATATDLSFASGIWFLIFAAMQIPVGAALDRFGPRQTASWLFAFGAAGGAAVFAFAQTPTHVTVAMALLGIGCSPILMAGYYILARGFPVAVFATLAAAMIGIGSLGNIAGSAPMAWAVTEFGWRETMLGLAVLSLITALAMWLLIQNPARVETQQRGSVFDLLRMPALWPIFALTLVNYAPAAGIRGLWAGPYIADVFQADAQTIGTVTLIMGLCMIAGSFIYGPMDRIFGTRKWVIFTGSMIGMMALFGLSVATDRNIWVSAGLLGLVGATGAAFPVLIAHAKAFFPTHLIGRGVTLMNLFGIGGVGLAQFATGPLHRFGGDRYEHADDPYKLIFVFFAILVALGLCAYLFSKDRTD